VYETVNRLGRAVLVVARQKRHGGFGRPAAPNAVGYGYSQTLVAELKTLLPVDSRSSFRRLAAQLVVVRTMLKLNAPYSKRVKAALANLLDEVAQIERAQELT
jgi:hypothetical protein